LDLAAASWSPESSVEIGSGRRRLVSRELGEGVSRVLHMVLLVLHENNNALSHSLIILALFLLILTKFVGLELQNYKNLSC
jgi:hypothetical protein